jgi:tetratricopeptide (TPR) repeat protein
MHVTGQIDPRYQVATLLRMWMPAGYRRDLQRVGVVPAAAHIDAAIPCSAPLDQLRARIHGGGELSVGDYLILTHLSEYETLLSVPAGPSLDHAFMRACAAAITNRASESYGATTRLVARAQSNFEPGITPCLVQIAFIAELRRQLRIEEAAVALRRERMALERSSGDLPPWLIEICLIRLQGLAGDIAHASGNMDEAIACWTATMNAARHYAGGNPLADWLGREFERRLVEQTVRAMLREAALDGCVNLARRAVELDPNDGRAWLLLGDTLFISAPEQAIEAYNNAAHLDLTLRSTAAYSAARAFQRAGKPSLAIHELKRCLDDSPHDERAAQLLYALATTSASPLRAWAQTTAGGRESWTRTTFRPFFDLSRAGSGPLFVYAPEIAFDQWVSGRTRPSLIQRVHPPGFRSALFQQARCPEYDVWEPRMLPEQLQTTRWSQLTGALAGFERVSLEQRALVCDVLIALAMYEPILFYLRSFDECPNHCSAAEADLAYRYAFAESMLFVGARGQALTPRRFVAVAERAPRGSRAGFAASLYLTVHSARFERNKHAVKHWGRCAWEQFQGLGYQAGSFAALIWESRLERATAYQPFLDGDYARALEALERARDLAHRLPISNKYDRIIRDENVYPVLQSMAKTYLAASDTECALDCLRQVTALDPWDSTGYIDLGNLYFQLERLEEAAASYRMAHSLAPPGAPHAAYLAGEAYRRLGRMAEATHMHLVALEVDPAGMSPRVSLAECATLPAARAFANGLRI